MAMSSSAFLLERTDERRLEVAFEFEELHPVERFIGFAERITEFGTIFRTRAAALGFAIICTDRTTGAEKLIAPNPGNAIAFRKCPASTGDPARKLACAVSQVSVLMEH